MGGGQTRPERGPAPRFADVVGQREAIWRLQAALVRGRLHHALLLEGPAGCGKTTVARALAGALLCRKPPKDAALPDRADLATLEDPIAWPLEACGRCPACRKMPEHPDFRVVEPEGRSSTIHADAARELVVEIGSAPHESPRRVVLVREADRLQKEAANALLKTIEEPIAANLFVLTTARPAFVLPTIRSRCLRVPFRALAPGVVRRLLAADNPDVPREALDLAAGLSAGGTARGAAFLAGDASEALAAAAAHGAAVVSGDLRGILDAAEAQAGDRAATTAALDLLLALLRDRIAVEAGATPLLGDAAESARKAFAGHPIEAAVVEADRVAEARRLVEANANSQMLFEWLGVASARAVARVRRGRPADG